MSTSKSDRKSVLPTSKSDEGTDSPTTKSDKETRSPATKSAREANKEKDVTSSGKLASSVDVRPLALLEKESQMKRLAEFNVEQDFGSVVKQVKKKKKKPAGAYVCTYVRAYMCPGCMMCVLHLCKYVHTEHV